MISPIIEFFEKLITQFSWRRLFFIIIISFIAGGSLIIYESYTGYFRLSRIERSTKLLNDLQRLSHDISNNKDDNIRKIYKGISDDLNAYVNHRGITPFSLPTWLLKALSAATLWILITFLFLLSKGEDNKKAALGTLVASIPCIGIGIMLPDFSNPLWNHVGYPILSFTVVLVFLALIMQKKK